MTPGRPLLIALGVWALLGLLAIFLPSAAAVWKLGGVLLVAAAGIDALDLSRHPGLQVRRLVNRNLPLDSWSRVEIGVRNPTRRHLHAELHDLHPADFQTEGMPRELEIAPGRNGRLHYRVRPPRRGNRRFEGVDIRLRSAFGLWQQRRRIPLEDEVRIFPNFAEISHYTLLATDNRLSQLGVRRRQRRGEGNDFHQLREYRVGDSLRQIDWNATARNRRLISREYQDERDQQILFLVDCGRRMRHADEGRVHLDEALNAMLLLAYVAVHQGDAVGFMSFGGVKRWFAPRKGAHTVTALLNATYDLQSTTEAADYLEATRQLMPVQRRRAMVVMLTNSRDEDRSDLEAAVKLLSRRHLVVIADLRESALDEVLDTEIGDLNSALRFQATHDYLDSRRQSHEALGHQGAHVLDLRPAQLPVALVNKYFAIKRGGSL